MEVAGIDSIHTLKKVSCKEAVAQAAPTEDTLLISSESQKKAEWVKMLHNMPDIRPEKIAHVMEMHPSPNTLREVAKRLTQSEFS